MPRVPLSPLLAFVNLFSNSINEHKQSSLQNRHTLSKTSFLFLLSFPSVSSFLLLLLLLLLYLPLFLNYSNLDRIPGVLISCMAVSLLSYDVSDLCLGKPAIVSLPISATVGDALSSLKKTGESFLSVWSCDHQKKSLDFKDCRCVGKVCMVDILVFLCKEENLASPGSALKAPVSTLLGKEGEELVRHVEPHCSLLEALDLILDGAQNLVVPIQSRRKKPQKLHQTHANGREFCWLNQEDIVRFLLNSIALFSPISALSVDSLGLVRSEVFAVGYHEPTSSAVEFIALAHSQQTSVAVVAPDGTTLIGEISPYTLAACDETVTAAIATLSAGDLMAYIDCGGPPEHLIWAVKGRLKDLNLEAMLDLFDEVSNASFSSSEEEEENENSASLLQGSPIGPLRSNRPLQRSSSYSARMVRRSEAIVCHKGSSLVAVVIQALAHRVSYVWVVDEGYRLVGIVTFSDILNVLRDHFQA